MGSFAGRKRADDARKHMDLFKQIFWNENENICIIKVII